MTTSTMYRPLPNCLNFLIDKTQLPKFGQLVLLFALLGFSLVGFGQDEILLYENDFETYNIEPSNTFVCSNGVPFDDLDLTLVNELWGGTGSGTGGDVFFNQTFTVETILINGEDNRYTDPDGIGGNYCIGMLTNSGNDDMLSLTLNGQSLAFLNISFLLSAIDLSRCNSFGVDVPIMKIRIYDTPDGIFDFNNKGTEIGDATIEGIEPMADKYTFNWVETNTNINIEESTNGNISIVFDLIQSGYGAFDNLRITAKETCDSTEINLENGLVAHYPFQDNATDVSSNTNNGELFGATSTTDRFGNEGNAFHFEGSSYIRIPDHPTLRPQAFTISLWSRFDDLGNNLQLLLDKHLGTEFLDSYEIWFEYNAIQASISDENDFGSFLTKQLMPDSLKWYHIVYSFSDENDIANLYIDTMLVDSKNETTTIAYDSEPLLIGASNDLQTPQAFFKGDIDDVRIYDRVLSSCEIEALFELPYVSYIETDCADGIDNDGDGFLDCEDLDCVTNNLCDDNTNISACPVDSSFMLRPGDGVFTCASAGSSDGTVVAIKNIDEVLANGLKTNEDISSQISLGRKFSKDEIGGEVFGTCIDDAGNIYVAATTLYNYDRSDFENQNDFASIIKIKGDLLQIDTLFTSVLKQSANEKEFKNKEGYAVYVENNNGWDPPNLRDSRITYSGLGNVCFDSNRNHLLVTNFDDGKIWRIETNGKVIDSFDPFELDNEEPGFAPLGERLWGIQVFPLPNDNTEVYFGVWCTDRRIENTNSPLNITNGKNLLMSVIINSSGSFESQSLDTITIVPDINVRNKNNVNQPISDITISKDGLRLIFACKTMSADISLIGNYNHAFAHHSSLFYIERNNSQTEWKAPIRFNISNNKSIGNSAGGVDFGPKQAVSNFDVGSICDQMVWASGDNLFGEAKTYGLQGFSIFEVFNDNPVEIGNSYIIDADGSQDVDKSYLGDIEIFKCDCFECNISLSIRASTNGDNCCFEADLRNLGVSTDAAKIEIVINDEVFQFDTSANVSTNFVYLIENEKLVLNADTSSNNYPLLPNLNSNNFLNFCILNNEEAISEYTFTVKYFDLDNEELNLCQQSLLVKTDGCVISPSPKGCTDTMACNYNPSATIDDGSCIPCYKDCDGNFLTDRIPGTLCENENSTALLSYNDINCNCVDTNIVVQCVVETTMNPVFAGEEYCFMVTVTDSLTNDTLVGFPVSYYIEGANQSEVVVDTTNQFGQIEFCYPAINPGLDFINITSGNFNIIFSALIFDFNFSPINLNFGPFNYTSSSGSLIDISNINVNETDSVCTTIVIEDDFGEIITGVEVTIISTGVNTGDVLVQVTSTTNLQGEVNFCSPSPGIGLEECIISIPSMDAMMTTDTIIYLNWIDPEGCQNEPGLMQTSNAFVCANETVFVREAFSTQSPNSVKAYILHESKNFDGTYLSRNTTGRFASHGADYTNRPLYISAVIGPPGADSYPNLEDVCTVWTPYGAYVVFFNPITVNIIDERCVAGLHYADVQISGGVGGLTPNFAYTFVSDGKTNYRNVSANDVLTFGPYNGSGMYKIEAYGSKNCKAELINNYQCDQLYRNAAVAKNGPSLFNKNTLNANVSIKAVEIYSSNGQQIPSNIKIDYSSSKVDLTAHPQGLYFVKFLLLDDNTGEAFFSIQKVVK